MRALIQRVQSASVNIAGNIQSKINQGLLVFLGIEAADTAEDIEWLSGKITKMRLFADDGGVMNLSINDIKGELLLVSQFTLHASTKKGNRPSYIYAAKPDIAIPLYEKMIAQLNIDMNQKIQTGTFGADMKVALVNDGPVTIFLDSKNKE